MVVPSLPGCITYGGTVEEAERLSAYVHRKKTNSCPWICCWEMLKVVLHGKAASEMGSLPRADTRRILETFEQCPNRLGTGHGTFGRPNGIRSERGERDNAKCSR